MEKKINYKECNNFVTREVVETLMHPPKFDMTYYLWRQDYIRGRISKEQFKEFERKYK